MNIEHVVTAGLCMQCGTCAGLCPAKAIAVQWSRKSGPWPRVDGDACTDCGACVDVCPGEGLDFAEGAWWRERNGGAPSRDFLGPWRGVWFGSATDPAVRYEGASGGVATAILQGALATGVIDAALVCRVDPVNALAVEPVLARSPDEIAACRGSKYNVVAMNTLLHRVMEEPGRYAVTGLPCHIQGLRLAQRRYPVLEERLVLGLGIFCGWSSEPRATEVMARRAGVSPRDLTSVRYRGPGWPGGLRLETQSGESRQVPFRDYDADRCAGAYVPPRCRLCPDALAELADISVGDAWLARFERTDTTGVSDVIARTPAGEQLVDRLTPDWLTLMETTPEEMVASQVEIHRAKRRVYRGRCWLRSLTGRAVPDYPGILQSPSIADRAAGIVDFAQETVFRAVGDLRYR